MLVDPYVTRFRTGLFTGAFDPTTRLRTDKPLVRRHAGTPEVICVTHTHWDHLNDVPFLAKATGARVIGTETTYHVLRSFGVDAAQLVDAVDHEPFDAPGGGVADGLARLDRVGVEHLRRRHAEREQQVELRRRGDLEARALLDQHLQHARVGIGLDRIVRAHARQGRAEAPRLGAHDVQIDQQDGLLVRVPLEVLLDAREVEADFRVGVERELRLGAELLYCGGSGHRGLG